MTRRLPLLLALSLLAGLAFAQPPSINTITVTATGSASAAPTQATLTLGVTTNDANPTQAFDQASQAMTRVRAALLKAGVPSKALRTSTFTATPLTRRQADGSTRTTFRVQHLYTLTLDHVAQVAGVLQAALDAGATTVDRITFGLTDPTQLAYQARRQASVLAHAKAAQLASDNHLHLMRVLSIQERPSSGGIQPGVALMTANAAQQPIEAGSLTTSVTLTITYATTPQEY